MITVPGCQKNQAMPLGMVASVHDHISPFILVKFVPCILYPTWGKTFLQYYSLHYLNVLCSVHFTYT
jgi:hypothetical protein